jgi:macrolide transport system ATP-binding/permease protein
MDSRVLALSAGVCILSTLVIGLVPAIQTKNMALSATLKSEMSGVVGGHRKSWLRSGLVVVQVSLSFVLLVGAALLLQSLQKIRTTSPGFSTTGVLETAVPLTAAGYDAPRAKIFQDELIDRVAALPGVESAAYARVTPLGYSTYSSAAVEVDGYQQPSDQPPSVDYNQVSPAYFATMGIPLISGREFTRLDDEKSPLVAIVNQSMAARYWLGRDPVGQRLRVKAQWVQVIGVAADSRYESMRETPRPFFYVPLRQDFARVPSLNIRTSQPPQTMAAAVSREVRRLDGNLALYEMITLQEQVDRSTSPQKVAVTLVGILGALALALAAVGLYAVMSHAVSQSTRELGLRSALGARTTDVFRLVLSRGLALTAVGIALGAATSLGLTRLLGYLLFKVSPRDPLAFGSAFVVLMMVSLVACALPAWRAMRLDPMFALRDE